MVPDPVSGLQLQKGKTEHLTGSSSDDQSPSDSHHPTGLQEHLPGGVEGKKT